MLTITVGAQDVYNEVSQMFETQGGVELHLEHSLVSLSKWESIYEKPFLDPQSQKTSDEMFAYIECMLLSTNPPEDFRLKLSEKNFKELNAYIDRKMTATWFSEIQPETRNQEKVTSELIYYWMTVFSIPFECEKWHLNRLFTLIRICNVKQQKPKKMSKAEIAARQRQLNAQRRAATGSKG
jgi:hypothetical protein